jgi:hypothetical protein
MAGRLFFCALSDAWRGALHDNALGKLPRQTFLQESRSALCYADRCTSRMDAERRVAWI